MPNMEATIESLSEQQCFRSFVRVATWVGAIFLLFHLTKLIWSLVQGLRLYVLSQWCCRGNLLKKYGQWVIVSGGTDGIGLAMAKNLARRGHSLVIIGRNKEKLASTKYDLQIEPNVGDVVTVCIDLSDSSEANFERVKNEIDPDHRDIGVLLNCAGIADELKIRFHAADMDYIRRQVNVNILATLYLTRMVLPGMVERQRGLVINFSSQLGLMPVPYFGVYSATKSFVNMFSKTLQAEYSSYPIDVVNLSIGPVVSKMLAALSDYNEPTVFSPTPEHYAQSCLNAIANTRIARISGYWMHGLMNENLEKLTYFNLDPIIVKINYMFNNSHSQLTPRTARKVKAPANGASGEKKPAT